MGFPLSTDIFGQLAWLVRQVKLLVFRVTRIEQSGTGSAQNINQVLATGNTAANKFLQFNSIINSSALLIGNDTVNGLSIYLNGENATSNLTANLLNFTEIATGNTITYSSSGMYIGPVGNKDGLLLDDDQYKLGQSDNDSSKGGLDLNFGTGHYRIGDWADVTLPNTYNVYLDISSRKNESSIKSYYQGSNKGLYINHQSGPYGQNIYGFNDEQYNSYFGMTFSGSNEFALTFSNNFVQGGLFTTAAGNLRILVNGTPYYIELWN